MVWRLGLVRLYGERIRRLKKEWWGGLGGVGWLI